MIPQKIEAVYLSDGAYATFAAPYQTILTANHHDPAVASDTVYLDETAMARFVRIAREHGFRFGPDPEGDDE